MCRHIGAGITAALWVCSSAWAGDGRLTADEQRMGWVSIFDGQTLKGWHVSAKTGHGTGGRWVVEDGAICGSQDKPGNGGIVVTNEMYGDFEVALEMNNDYTLDSGLFLRSTEDGKCYQAMIDYHRDGNLMGVYGEGIGGFAARNFQMLETPDQIKVLDYPKFPCPFTPEQWKTLWKHGRWNDLRARIVGNPPTVTTWINGVKVMEWTDTEKRLPDRGMIGLQVHGGGYFPQGAARYRNIRVRHIAPDNTLTAEEKAAGWVLLFDGRTLDGWMNDKRQPSRSPVEQGSINPHGNGAYLLVHEKTWTDFIWQMDFKISKGCNSGIFLRIFSLTPKPGWDVAFNGLEVAIDDRKGAGYHDTGAIYDLVKPMKQAMKPAGEWNHVVITSRDNLITVALNDELVTRMDCDQFTEPGRRPDGTKHKFTGIVYKDFPRSGYIGLQDHGSPCWFKNIRILPLDTKRAR